MKQVAALVIAVAALAAPASALASPQIGAPVSMVRLAPGSALAAFPANVAPNRRALYAYATYLSTILGGVPTAQAADNAYVATITSSNGCQSALEPLTQPSQAVNSAVQHTLIVVGEEMGDDLSITFDGQLLPAFTKFSNTLLRLHWAHLSGATQVAKRYVNAETAVLEMLPSQLCQDAELAGTDPQKVPDGTRAFVKSYDKASTLADLALASLTKLMQSYEAPTEKSLIVRIATLATQFSTLTKSALLQGGAALSAALETS